MRLSFSYSKPELLERLVKVSEPYQNYSPTGKPTSFGIDLEFPELDLHKSVKSRDFHLLRGKIEDTLRAWEKRYQRHLEQVHRERRAESVDELNREAAEILASLRATLAHTLDVDDTVDWDAIRRRDAFRIAPEELAGADEMRGLVEFNNYGRPVGFRTVERQKEPTLAEVAGEFGSLSRLFRKKHIATVCEARRRAWRSQEAAADADDASRQARFNDLVEAFEEAKAAFEAQKQEDNEALDDIRRRYELGDAAAVEEYCDLVLSASAYPDHFPKSWILEYRPEGRMVVVDYELPIPSDLPDVESYKYVKSRDEVVEKPLSDAVRKKLYDEVVFQICVRTIHELFEADAAGAIDAVAFNGIVNHLSPATGTRKPHSSISREYPPPRSPV